MTTLIDQGKQAFDARLAQLETAKKQVEAEAATLATDLKSHIDAHLNEVAAAQGRLARVVGQEAARVATVPALVLSDAKKAGSTARAWLVAHWRDLVLVAALVTVAAFLIRHV